MPLPEIPNAHAGAVLLLTAVALFLFTRERVPLETSSLLVLVALTVGFELFPFAGAGGPVHAADFFHGFGHEALVAVCGLMIAGQGLVRTGALEPVGRRLAGLWRRSPSLSLLVTLVAAAVMSAFINNTPIVVLLLPILTSVSLRTGASPSTVLLPMGFATLVGGTATTIGTSTNLLVVSVAAQLGTRLEMFDFMLPAAIAGGVGLAYLWLLAPRLLPAREAPLADTSPRLFAAQLGVLEDSVADGLTLAEAIKRTDGRMRVLRVKRGDNTFLLPLPDVVLGAGDQLVLNDTPALLKEFEAELGGALYSGGSRVDEDHALVAGNQQMAEIAVVLGSPIEGVSLRRVRFVERYQLVVLAMHRAGRQVRTTAAALADIELRAGDVLLVQGPEEQIRAMKHEDALLVLDATADLPRQRKAPLALMIMAAVVGLAATGVLPIAISAAGGSLAMVATGCLGWRDATRALSAQIVLIVVASLALGVALIETGGTEYLTGLFLALTAGSFASVTLSGLMLLMAVLTNVVSNNAAAVIGTPVAMGVADALGLPPEVFVLAVLFGANLSYATPMAYKTNLLVMTAGGYRFSDFLRVGLPLILIMWLVLSLVLPALYGL